MFAFNQDNYRKFLAFSCRSTALLADMLEARHLGEQTRVLRIQIKAEDVQFVFLELGSQLGSWNEFDPLRSAGGSHPFAALDGVMIGQGERRKTEPLAVPNDFLRGERAIREDGVQMQVGKHFSGAGASIPCAPDRGCR